MTDQPDEMCESCGSNITGQAGMGKPHLCSIRTAKGWRQEIPLHLRRRPLAPTKIRLGITDSRDWDLYEEFINKHREAAALVVDTRTGLVIQAVYDSPASMHLSENVDHWINLARLMPFSDDDE